MTRFQKIMLAIAAGMLVFFGGLTAVLRAHPGVAFEDGLLKITGDDGRIVYSGKAHGTPVTITVAYPTNFKYIVDFTIGTDIHDVCEVEYPLAPITTAGGYPVNGIRITKNGELLFEGGYDPESEFGWYDNSGGWLPHSGIRISFSGDDSWHSYETTKNDAVRFAFGPDTAAYGDSTLFGMAALLSLLMAVRAVFWKSFFRFEHRWARDPEPTDGYLLLEYAGWVILAVAAAGFYIAALTKIY